MSIGIVYNIFFVKLVIRYVKFVGVYYFILEVIFFFVYCFLVEDFFFVGYFIKFKVEVVFKIIKVGELLDISKGRWKSVLGEKIGEMLWGYLRGIDLRKLEGDKVRKSVSVEMNVRFLFFFLDFV